ncbi:MAG: hypothetical protein HKP39_12405 [Eudoraea sp.]|nr:hypothetical protein [Maribacter sp.]NNK17765.1 hypothetical protein [Maribacter sp.]NNL03068.1 hypothetical protein [Eudoraea sp.]
MKTDNMEAKTIGQISTGLLGMLAFVLAFTFSMAASQYEKRKQMVLQEANAVGTAYLRADLIDEPFANDIKQLLKEYVETRLNAVNKENTSKSLVRSIEIHRLLWTQVRTAAKTHPNTNTALMVQSVNEVIDMHEKRVTAGLRDKIPASIWLTLFGISVMAMLTIGIELGISGSRRLIVIIPMMLAFAALTTLIVELNRPQEGILKVGQESMISLQKSIELNLNL